MQPGVEPVRIAECPQVTPGDHQRVLNGILGPIDISQDPLCNPEEPVTAHADQVSVSLPVPHSMGACWPKVFKQEGL
jgi:hypothetical protein